MNNTTVIIIILAVTVGMFIWGRWRHDLVAMSALLACVLTGLIPADIAFAGFGHPAVITVACVLLLGAGLQSSGAVVTLTHHILPDSDNVAVNIFALMGLAAVLSGFMNNVGALSLLMPVAIQIAARHDMPPGKLLMPLSFGSILGGMSTLIGTPPNLIVSGYRETTGVNGFAMFDFSPVGITVAISGIMFIAVFGWKLVPARKKTDAGGFDSGTYFSEVRVTEGSKSVGLSIREAEQLLDDVDAQITSLIRSDVSIPIPGSRRVLRAGDILVIEIEPESLAKAITVLGLEMEEAVAPDALIKHADDTDQSNTTKVNHHAPKSDEIEILELVVTPNAALINRTATGIELRTRYGINLLAISRKGRRSFHRLRTTSIRAGDVLLLQGTPEAVYGFASQFGCLPLAERDIRVPDNRKALSASLVMLVAVLITALGVLPASVGFALAAAAYIAFNIIPLRQVYSTIDWPVIVLLAAMFPVADAVGSTGAADLMAHWLLDNVAQGQAIAALVVILLVTMFLTDMMNNAATAAVMCPIAISSAHQLGVSADAFLMAVAVGASCAFLTPIGHQNNTLILGPGGFSFGDYWHLGLALDVIVVAVSVPMLLWVWPL